MHGTSQSAAVADAGPAGGWSMRPSPPSPPGTDVASAGWCNVLVRLSLSNQPNLTPPCLPHCVTRRRKRRRAAAAAATWSLA
ncbi:hypothetical protein GGTG_10496 [Gaeumannomyces tritici R3-111a-1]|uniref:Uncharacterized protein n=1 Tax=Gaeumannomyces tritici (strain R3-111a-1) TaxID=644352 RepID=J3PAH0_GAET3|nr:hypothetical protein GGTG_10496 [Gaeumannomyces tritici R3-111a-1]EJT71236.1 hypothetical protein GGTG_10496 [Gaeumannomyces tritici R3-111a-1]